MRQIVIRYKYLILFAWVLIVGACDHSSTLSFEDAHPTGLHTIRHLKAMARGEVTAIHEEVVIEGVVTGNDYFGEFNRQLVLEDHSGGITLALGSRNIYQEYPFGSFVRIRCNGLQLHNHGGSIELGTTPDPLYGSIALTSEVAARHLSRLDRPIETPIPQTIRIADIGPQHIDCYVHLADVQFVGQALWCDRDALSGKILPTERIVEDSEGYRLSVRTSATAHYAEEPLPTGRGSLYGIIDYFGGSYTLRITQRGFFF